MNKQLRQRLAILAAFLLTSALLCDASGAYR